MAEGTELQPIRHVECPRRKRLMTIGFDRIDDHA